MARFRDLLWCGGPQRTLRQIWARQGSLTVEFASQRALAAILRGLARGAALTERQADAVIRELIDEAELARSRHHDQDAAALEKLAEILGDEFEAGG